MNGIEIRDAVEEMVWDCRSAHDVPDDVVKNYNEHGIGRVFGQLCDEYWHPDPITKTIDLTICPWWVDKTEAYRRMSIMDFGITPEPEEDPRRVELGKLSAEFHQEGNTLGTTEEYEAITLEGEFQLPGDEPFWVIRTDGWSFDNVSELQKLVDTLLPVIERYKRPRM